MPKMSPPWFPESAKAASPRTKGFPVQGNRSGAEADQPLPLPKLTGAVPPLEIDPQVPAPRSSPWPPKACWLVAGLLVAVVGLAAYAFWKPRSGSDAYGTIEGRVVGVVAPCQGVTRAAHVHEGDNVRQGQLLVTIDDLALEQELARLRDDLRIARATLEAELAKLRWNMQQAGDRHRQQVADLHELWGKLARDKATLDQMEVHLNRSDLSRHAEQSADLWYEDEHRAASRERLDFEPREIAPGLPGEGAGRTGRPSDWDESPLKPTLNRIRDLQAEIFRKQQYLQRGQLRSPVSGVVVSRRLRSGEPVEQAGPLLEILEDGSLEAVVFFSRDQAGHIEIGDRIPIVVGPDRTLVTGVVKQLADPPGIVPPSIRRHYGEHEPLVAVHLLPEFSRGAELDLELGSAVEVPRLGRWTSYRLGLSP